MIGARVIALGIGYLFGLFQTGYLYGKSQGLISAVREVATRGRQIPCVCLESRLD